MLKPPLGLIKGKVKDLLRRVQGQFCLRQLVVSYDRRSELKTVKKPTFLKSHLKRRSLTLYRDSQLSQLGKEYSSW